jgi:protein-disulfide isomerase
MRAAVDVNCLATQSTEGYWNMVDYVHGHLGEIWNSDAKTLPEANQKLDQLTRDEGKRQKVDAAKLDACIAKQDTTAIKASIQQGESLGIGATPSLFINGNKIDGAVSPEFIYKIIDTALTAAGKTPPPPYVPPAAPAAGAKPGQ